MGGGSPERVWGFPKRLSNSPERVWRFPKGIPDPPLRVGHCPNHAWDHSAPVWGFPKSVRDRSCPNFNGLDAQRAPFRRKNAPKVRRCSQSPDCLSGTADGRLGASFCSGRLWRWRDWGRRRLHGWRRWRRRLGPTLPKLRPCLIQEAVHRRGINLVHSLLLFLAL